jgi:hypothetical protein
VNYNFQRFVPGFFQQGFVLGHGKQHRNDMLAAFIQVLVDNGVSLAVLAFSLVRHFTNLETPFQSTVFTH